jgi:hypothetical protein
MLRLTGMIVRFSEWIALAYFCFLAATAGRAPVAALRRWQVIAAAATVAFLILALSREPGVGVTLIVRDTAKLQTTPAFPGRTIPRGQ